MKNYLFIFHHFKSCFLLVSFLLMLNGFAKATDGIDGCHIVAGSQDRSYHTQYTAGGSPNNGQWIETTSGGGGFNKVTTSVCFEDTGISCVVYKYGTGSSPTSGDILYPNTLNPTPGFYTILTTNCPIDDYIPALFIFATGIFYFRLKIYR